MCVCFFVKVDRICTGREVIGNDIKVSAEPHVGEVSQDATLIFVVCCLLNAAGGIHVFVPVSQLWLHVSCMTIICQGSICYKVPLRDVCDVKSRG